MQFHRTELSPRGPVFRHRYSVQRRQTWMFFPDLLTDEDGDPHRDPGDHGRDALQDLTFSLNDP